MWLATILHQSQCIDFSENQIRQFVNISLNQLLMLMLFVSCEYMQMYLWIHININTYTLYNNSLAILSFDEIDVHFWTATANLSLILRVDLKLCLKIQ